jgi:hypothetical protein
MSSPPSDRRDGIELRGGKGNTSPGDGDPSLQRLNHKPRQPTLNRSGSQVFLPRLIHRNLPFNQSTNRIQVQNKTHRLLWSLLSKDLFHIMLRTPGYITIPIMVAVWVLATLVWAQIYVFVDTNNVNEDCGLGEPGFPIEFGTGFAFSLITISTVGCKYMFA